MTTFHHCPPPRLPLVEALGLSNCFSVFQYCDQDYYERRK